MRVICCAVYVRSPLCTLVRRYGGGEGVEMCFRKDGKVRESCGGAGERSSGACTCGACGERLEGGDEENSYIYFARQRCTRVHISPPPRSRVQVRPVESGAPYLSEIWNTSSSRENRAFRTVDDQLSGPTRASATHALQDEHFTVREYRRLIRRENTVFTRPCARLLRVPTARRLGISPTPSINPPLWPVSVPPRNTWLRSPVQSQSHRTDRGNFRRVTSSNHVYRHRSHHRTVQIVLTGSIARSRWHTRNHRSVQSPVSHVSARLNFNRSLGGVSNSVWYSYAPRRSVRFSSALLRTPEHASCYLQEIWNEPVDNWTLPCSMFVTYPTFDVYGKSSSVSITPDQYASLSTVKYHLFVCALPIGSTRTVYAYCSDVR